jgi:hypothetical protein
MLKYILLFAVILGVASQSINYSQAAPTNKTILLYVKKIR